MMEALPRLNDRVLLDDSLRPFRMLLRFSGLHPDCCGQQQRNWLFRSVRFIVTFLAVLLVSTNCLSLIHSLYSSFNLFEDNGKALYTMSAMSLGLHFMYRYMKYEDEFRQFYSDWREIEMNVFNDASVAKKRKINKLLYIYFFGKLFTVPLTVYFLYLWVDFPSFCRIFDPSFSKAMTIYLYAFITAITFYFYRIYMTLGEVVPAVFFYHVGCVVEAFQKQLEETLFSSEMSSNDSDVIIDNAVNSNSHVKFRNVNTFQYVWKKYETVYDFVNRANQLISASILCIDISAFVLMSTGIFNVLQDVQIVEKLVFSVVRLIEILQFILLNRLMSHPSLAQEELKTSLATLLSQKWQLLCEDDRNLLVAFHTRLDSVKLAASPFNLYQVKPSNILSMLSLIVTYVIVLIQFN